MLFRVLTWEVITRIQRDENRMSEFFLFSIQTEVVELKIKPCM